MKFRLWSDVRRERQQRDVEEIVARMRREAELEVQQTLENYRRQEEQMVESLKESREKARSKPVKLERIPG